MSMEESERFVFLFHSHSPISGDLQVIGIETRHLFSIG
jgi:hypothetical protein